MDFYRKNQGWIDPTIFIISIALVLFGLWWAAVRVNRTVTMTVRSKEWSRQIRELEDYTTYACHPRTRTKQACTGFGDDRICRTEVEYYQDCGWETQTRTIDSWNTAGIYPMPPTWPTGYTIGSGHYERRSQRYTVNLSDDRVVWNHSVWSESTYNKFPVRGHCQVSLNWFRVIVKVEKCQI
jgi:hypothetical protein